MSTENKKKNEVAKIKEDITQTVLARIQDFQEAGELTLHKNYNAPNALKAAYLVLNEVKTKDGKPALTACKPSTVAQALLKMVVLGLSPTKGQLYFIPYGEKLECTVSYLGEILLAKRFAELKEINANVITEGEVFEFGVDTKTGRRFITKHSQTLESIGNDDKIIGAYAVYTLNDGTTNCDVMSMKQIEQSWAQGSNGPAKKNFKVEMAKRTILKRAIKQILRSSDDSALYNVADEKKVDETKGYVDNKVNKEANREVFDIDDVDFEDVKEEKSVKQVEAPTQEASAEEKPQPGGTQAKAF